MEIDELANSDGDDEIDLVPLVMSDLDPQFPKAAATQKETPTPPAARSAKSAHLSGLSIRHPTTPHKTNGVNKTSSTAAVRQPIVTIPLASTTPTAHRPHTSTPKKEVPTAASVSLPALYTPKKNDTDSGTSVPQPPDSPENAPASAKTKSPIVAVGRRSKKVSDVRIKGGRPKGWKPGMSYREVALRNLGVDPNDPSLPPKVLLPPRPRGRPPGRPRLPGRPKVKPTQSLGFKRIGRPPIQSIDAVQRSIFLNNQACFAPFMCEWAGCHAELQNMATLRKHVAVVHGRPASAVKTCQWRKCASRVPRVEYKDSADTDADGRTLLEHIEYQHLTPLSWHRGDGFANNGHTGPPEPPAAAALLTKSRSRDEAKLKTKDDAKASATIPAASFYTGASAGTAPEMSLDGIPSEDLPRYLLDDEGKQVTPLLRDTVLESSPTFWTQEERGRRLKDLYRLQQQHLNKRPDRSLGRMI
ncbi:hypothetical protein SEUCBS139899_007174 [Sporothrix eucalyptigena]|uniref:C2H2-type domain-containing protein n=1 Tax=Sporothrix eucalyptigena TaxID=1812306 RepID=A0ABP0C3T2_9PEZI